MSGGIVLLATEGPSTRIVWNALRARFSEIHVVMEEPVSRRQLLRGRMKRVGALAVLGQLAFMAGVLPVLRRAARNRVDEIQREHGLDDSPVSGEVIRVPSVNSDEARAVLKRLDPAVVVVNGTRIIGRTTLAAVPVPWINMHAGITPLFRGVHGGYWALAEGKPEIAGTTVHLVDRGIDTGAVIAQASFTATPRDSFATYPFLHLAVGVPLLIDAVAAALDGTLRTRDAPAGLDSVLRYHPTIWEYFARRLARAAR